MSKETLEIHHAIVRRIISKKVPKRSGMPSSLPVSGDDVQLLKTLPILSVEHIHHLLLFALQMA